MSLKGILFISGPSAELLFRALEQVMELILVVRFVIHFKSSRAFPVLASSRQQISRSAFSFSGSIHYQVIFSYIAF